MDSENDTRVEAAGDAVAADVAAGQQERIEDLRKLASALGRNLSAIDVYFEDELEAIASSDSVEDVCKMVAKLVSRYVHVMEEYHTTVGVLGAQVEDLEEASKAMTAEEPEGLAARLQISQRLNSGREKKGSGHGEDTRRYSNP